MALSSRSLLSLLGCMLLAGCYDAPSEEELRKLFTKEMEVVHERALANGPPIVVLGQLSSHQVRRADWRYLQVLRHVRRPERHWCVGVRCDRPEGQELVVARGGEARQESVSPALAANFRSVVQRPASAEADPLGLGVVDRGDADIGDVHVGTEFGRSEEHTSE